MPLLSDATLTMLSRARLPVIGRRLARRAAARALHGAALAGAPQDAAVLALLGLHAAAARELGGDAVARRGAMLARAAVDGNFGARVAAALPLAWRNRLAAAIAPRDPRAAAALLPESPRARAACLVAAGDTGGAIRLLGDDRSAEAMMVRAAAACATGDPVAAAAAIDAAFSSFGLTGPLASSPCLGLSDYDGRDGQVADGPLVSVIVPLHDGAATIGTTLRSLARQRWRALEILVCDDRSTDAGPALVARLAAADPRIRLLANSHAPGVSGARNSAIEAAHGDFLAFLDADDWAHPERIARQMARLGAGAATVSAHYRVDESGQPVAPRVFPMLRLCPISTLVRRAVIEQIGPFDISRAGADAELLGRLDTIYGRRAVPRDRAPLTVALWRPASLSSDPARGLFDLERLAYRERWMRRHAKMVAAGGLPRPVPTS